MPQMSPYNWFYLNLYFTLMFLLIMLIMYFYNIKKLNKSLNYKKINLYYKIKW